MVACGRAMSRLETLSLRGCVFHVGSIACFKSQQTINSMLIELVRLQAPQTNHKQRRGSLFGRLQGSRSF